MRYNPRIFPGLIYQNRKIDRNCLIFSNGKINCNGAWGKQIKDYGKIGLNFKFVESLFCIPIYSVNMKNKIFYIKSFVSFYE